MRVGPRITKAGGAWNDRVPGPTRCMECCGGVLLSHTLPGAVPSALAGLASRFGMDAGRFPAAMTTTSGSTSIHLCPPLLFRGVVLVVIRIVATSILRCLSTRLRLAYVVDKCLLVSAH